MSEVKILRLTSGEELIGKVEKTDDDSYIIKKPAIILPVGEGRVGLAPYLPYCEVDDGLEVSSRFVMFDVEPVVEFKNQYNSAFWKRQKNSLIEDCFVTRKEYENVRM